MATINTMRGVLVAAAALAALVAAAYGQWAATGILVLGILGHLALWYRLHRDKAHPAAGAPQPPTAGTP
ncbi:MAG TPA: hypothetical protein VM307_05790 [Egibacteraceae bacterium]|nr:hypothetical protein [Egibacteraceae bacterium]